MNQFNRGPLIALLAVGFVLPVGLVYSWTSAADSRLQYYQKHAEPEEVAIASASDATYCSANLKKILRRVLLSCGLAASTGTRGCQPTEAKNVATVSGDDFNALFEPMKERGGIIQYESESIDLDAKDRQLIDEVFADQQGASYFFVVARSSPDGDTAYNRQLSKGRAEAVMTHLQEKFNDPDLEREVGLLWLGEEFAQLDKTFCEWRRSGERCSSHDLNRGAFVSWIDCTL